jgi:hypothetical protein
MNITTSENKKNDDWQLLNKKRGRPRNKGQPSEYILKRYGKPDRADVKREESGSRQRSNFKGTRCNSPNSQGSHLNSDFGSLHEPTYYRSSQKRRSDIESLFFVGKKNFKKPDQMSKEDIEDLIRENKQLQANNAELNEEVSELQKSYGKARLEKEELEKFYAAAFYQAGQNNAEANKMLYYQTLINTSAMKVNIGMLEARNEKLEYVSSCLWIRDIVKSFLKKVFELTQIEPDHLNEGSLMNNSNLDIISERFGLPKDKLIQLFLFLKNVKDVCNNVAHTGNKYPQELLNNKETVDDCLDYLKSLFGLSPEAAEDLSTLMTMFNFTMDDVQKKRCN